MGVLSCYLVLRTVTLKRAISKFFPHFFLVGCFELVRVSFVPIADLKSKIQVW